MVKKTSVKSTPKPKFLPKWQAFSTAVSEFIALQLDRTTYNRAAYYHDLSFIINQLLETDYAWFAESKTSWKVVADELQSMASELGTDLKYSVEMGKLDRDMYHYFNRFEILVRKVQFNLDTDHYDWYTSPTEQPLAINEIIKNLLLLTGELKHECTNDANTLLRWADNLWCRQAYEDLDKLYNLVGKDPLFDPNDFGAGGPTPWSKP